MVLHSEANVPGIHLSGKITIYTALPRVSTRFKHCLQVVVVSPKWNLPCGVYNASVLPPFRITALEKSTNTDISTIRKRPTCNKLH